MMQDLRKTDNRLFAYALCRFTLLKSLRCRACAYVHVCLSVCLSVRQFEIRKQLMKFDEENLNFGVVS